MPIDRSGVWRPGQRGGRFPMAAAVLSMSAGIVLLVAGLVQAYRLGYGGGIDAIPLDVMPHARLGSVLLGLPCAVIFFYACWAYRRFNRTH